MPSFRMPIFCFECAFQVIPDALLHQEDAMKKKIFIDFAIPVAFLLLITLLFRFTGLDIILLEKFYDSERGWFLQQKPFWHSLFYYGSIPGLLLVLIALIGLMASFWSDKLVHWRKKAVFIIVCLALGPGLLVNGILKEHWGRPRPRYTEPFGGEMRFEYICQEGFRGEGKSFPCGHCSIGFFLLTPFFIFRKQRRGLALFFLGLGTGYGLLMSITRMAAGGHFASDALWAGGIVYLVGLGTYYVMGLNRPPTRNPVRMTAGKRKMSVGISVGVFVIIVGGLLLATPYISDNSFQLGRDGYRLTNYRNIGFRFQQGQLFIAPADSLSLDWESQGFGFPGSRLNIALTNDTADRYFEFALKEKGWFTELNNQIHVQLPFHRQVDYSFSLEKGDIRIAIPEQVAGSVMQFNLGQGDLRIRAGRNDEFRLECGDARVINFSDITLRRENGQYVTSGFGDASDSTPEHFNREGQCDISGTKDMFIRANLKQGQVVIGEQ